MVTDKDSAPSFSCSTWCTSSCAPSHFVLKGCIILMSLLLAVACQTGVVQVVRRPMGPAVCDKNALIIQLLRWKWGISPVSGAAVIGTGCWLILCGVSSRCSYGRHHHFADLCEDICCGHCISSVSERIIGGQHYWCLFFRCLEITKDVCIAVEDISKFLMDHLLDLFCIVCMSLCFGSGLIFL